MSDKKNKDVTVMRVDQSISKSWSGSTGSGEADAPRVLKQRFVLEEKLGSGGMGTVFRAKDLRKVEARDRHPYLAVKVLNNDFREYPDAFIALEREAAKSQSVSHPNIVSIFDYDKDGDVPYITMELLEGQELADLLRAYPNGIPDEMAWSIITDMCAGLSHAHSGGVVHADFKPSNVFVSPTSTAKILDFGIARAMQVNQEQGEQTQFDPTRLAALTPAYASREMLLGDNPEARDDLYSLGVVIYLVLTGHHPYGRLSADAAAAEELTPERPKRLTRRQWRVLQRCLAFSRQNRPASVSEVQQYLLQPSPWRSRSVLGVVAVFVFGFAVNYLIGDVELSKVKREVRQTTLFDTQVARITALIGEPIFDANWEQMVWVETERLLSLDAEQNSEEKRVPELLAGIREVYTRKVQASDEILGIVSYYERGTRYGEMPDAANYLRNLFSDRVISLLDTPDLDAIWMAELRDELGELDRLFTLHSDVAELHLEVADVLEQQILVNIEQQRFDLAERALVELHGLLFDQLTLESLSSRLENARVGQARQEQKRLLRVAEQTFSERLTTVLDVSCLSLDVREVASRFEALAAQHPKLATEGREQVGNRLARCVGQLGEIDRDSASALLAEAKSAFGELQALAELDMDPCALGYLVGNGAQSGRGGYCSDKLPGGDTGPRLVVVPVEGGGRFAITKHEISRALFGVFCTTTGFCEENSRTQLPATGIGISQVGAYADWLSELTGYTYRLPTREEWLRAAAGAPDPNRNCRVQINGVQRGLAPVVVSTGLANPYGLINVLGNVQEWVLDADKVKALGGAFNDPIQECIAQTVRDHGGEPDELTGFRLVREIS
ncbi:MAG: bifunctional serine/threonine-protein kinase/formylglycine-generating enzyme family protein [Gammaproteobacteria bacterium]|nr:bifunctional serine/threonine-protein kinase/formylglycine-generating enzyme family protein [Gammaproteobacteria bacterium]